MEDETSKIFGEQIGKLPKEIVDFISSASWDTDADEISSLYNLSKEESDKFKQEVTLVLVGLVHPDAFGAMLEQEVGIKGAILEALVANVEKKIFAPIRPALIEFFEKEKAENSEEASIIPVTNLGVSLPNQQTSLLGPSEAPARTWEKTPDIAPDNLPTDTASEAPEEPESFLPPLTPKPSHLGVELPSGEATHPFEEKMKKVFTAGQQSANDFAIEPLTPQSAPTPVLASSPMINEQWSNIPPSPRTTSADPYREPIE